MVGLAPGAHPESERAVPRQHGTLDLGCLTSAGEAELGEVAHVSLAVLEEPVGRARVGAGDIRRGAPYARRLEVAAAEGRMRR